MSSGSPVDRFERGDSQEIFFTWQLLHCFYFYSQFLFWLTLTFFFFLASFVCVLCFVSFCVTGVYAALGQRDIR